MKYTDRHALALYMTEVKDKKLPWLPAYLILGKDEWQRKIAEDLLWQVLLLEGWRYIRWRGSTVSLPQLSDELQTFDLFGSKRVLYVQEVEALSKEAQRLLAAQVMHRDSSLLLVLSAVTLAPSTALYKAVDAHGGILANETLRPRDKEQLCDTWLMERAHAAGKQLTSSVAASLRRQVGIDYHLLIQELDKLICYSGQELTLSEASVAAVVQTIPSDTVWQLGDSLLQNDTRVALNLCHSLLDGGMALIALIRQVRQQFQTAFEVAELSAVEVAKRYPQLKDFMIERQRRLANSYGRQRLPAAICALDACELAFKNGYDHEKLLLENLVISLANGIAPPLKLPLGATYVL